MEKAGGRGAGETIKVFALRQRMFIFGHLSYNNEIMPKIPEMRKSHRSARILQQQLIPDPEIENGEEQQWIKNQEKSSLSMTMKTY
jgi:hypothetical protein